MPLSISTKLSCQFAFCTSGVLFSTSFLFPQAALAVVSNPFVIDFEGLDDFETVGDFYNGGTGGNGENLGFDFGVTFSDNALALVDADAGGAESGNFGGEPTPDNILFFRSGSGAVMNVEDGFEQGFSLFYSAVAVPGQVNIYDGIDGQGTLLKSFELPKTPLEGAPDPTGQFSPFLPTGTTFDGIARSVVFEGAERRIGFDNITIGAAEPIRGFSFEYEFLKPPKSVPESSSAVTLLFLTGGSAWLGWRHMRRTTPGK